MHGEVSDGSGNSARYNIGYDVDVDWVGDSDRNITSDHNEVSSDVCISNDS